MDENKKPAAVVILVLPLGVEDSIFPWGIHLIKDYLHSTCAPLSIHVWDCRSDAFFTDLNMRYGSLLGKLFLSLEPGEENVFFGTTINPYIFFGLTAFLGEDFFRLTGNRKRLRRLYSPDLQNLHKEMNSYIMDKISDYTCQGPGSSRIWAFSVYDRTLFNTLHIARLVKENDPASRVILGGDYFDFHSAEQVLRSISFVDGVVVGYGEEVMRRLVLEQRQGISPDNLRIPGLVNHAYIHSRDQEEAHSTGEISVPPFYRDFTLAPGVSYVQRPHRGEIRILAQRGCSWGKCSFCTQLDRDMCFQVPVEHLVQGIQSILAAEKYRLRGTCVNIHFDSDENSPEMFMQFIKYLESIKDLKIRFNIDLWLQVKKFRRELVEALVNIDSKKIEVRFLLNFESLNHDTLKNMRKGHLPLHAVEAAKALQDTGHSFITNYLTHFPLENRKNISREAQILKSVVHLFTPPRGGINLFPYGANNRDAVSQNPRKYRVKIKPLAGDIWLKDVFGLDLPFTIWSHSYKEESSFNTDRLLINSYYRTMQARNAVYHDYWLANMHWGKVEITSRERLEIFSRLLKLAGRVTLHHLLQWIGKGRAFSKRNRLFFYLAKISAGNAPKSSPGRHMKHREIKDEGCYFFLQEGRLNKDCRAPGIKEKWSLPLNEDEQKILRCLYWTRKTRDVIRQFKDEMSESRVTMIIDRHLKLGSLVRSGDALLCVANDPEYWKGC